MKNIDNSVVSHPIVNLITKLIETNLVEADELDTNDKVFCRIIEESNDLYDAYNDFSTDIKVRTVKKKFF